MPAPLPFIPALAAIDSLGCMPGPFAL